MSLPLQLFMVQGSYLNYSPSSPDNPNPGSNGGAGQSVVLNFSKVLNTPISDINWSQIVVSWAGVTQSPTSGSFIAPPAGSGNSSQLKLNFTNSFPVASYLDNNQPADNSVIAATVNPLALPSDSFPLNTLSQPTSITTTSTPYSPAAIPAYIGFTISQDLNNYLNSIGSVNGSSVTSNSQVVYVSYPTGGPTWGAGTATGIPGLTATNFPSSQSTPSGAMSVSYNYALSDLTQTIPVGGSFSQDGTTYYYGLYNTSGPQGPISVPNIPVNYIQGGHFYISMASPNMPQGGQLVYTPEDLGTAPTAVNDPNGNADLIWAIGIEPYVATQPGWNVGMTDANADLTYIDLYQFPLNLQVYGPDGNPQSPTVTSGPKSVNGGAGSAVASGIGDGIYATLTSQSLYGQLTNQVQGYGRVVGPTLAVNPTNQHPNAYHSWGAYFDYLASSNAAAIILSGGSQNIPEPNAGGDLFNYVATFVRTTSNNRYALLTSYLTTPTPESIYSVIYVPYSDTSIMPGQNTLNTYMNQGGGIYGGNAGYVIINNVTSAQLSILENITQSSDFSSFEPSQFTIQSSLGGDASTAFAVGDMLSGFDFGVLGSQVLYTSPDNITINNTKIGEVASYLWWDAQGPVANNVWGPWAQPANVGETNTQLTNSFWNTYQFALNGRIAYNAAYYNNSSNANNSALTQRALTPDVYGYAFSDRLSNSKPISVEFNSVGQAPPYTGPAPQPPTPMPWGLGGSSQSSYAEVTIGAPTVLTPLFPKIVQGSLNSSQWDTQVWWSGSTNNYQMLYTNNSGLRASESSQITLPVGYTYTGAGKIVVLAQEDQAIWKNDSIGIQYARTNDNGQTFSLTQISKPNGDAWQYWTSADTTGNGVNELLWIYQDQYVGVTLLDAQGNKLSDNWYGGLGGSWTPVAAADFNNDGKADILWRDSSLQSSTYGAIATSITSSSGISHTSENWLGFVGQGLDWQYYGIGDFNGDGVTDTVWTAPVTAQDGSTQQVMSVMLTNQTGNGSLGSYWFSSPGEGWYLQGVADFNNDSYADTYWWNDSLNGGATFLTNNPGSWSTGAAPNAQGIWWGSPGADWKFSSISNIDSNNYADVMFVNSTGQSASQIGSASGAFQSNQWLGVTDSGWGVVPNQLI